MEQTQKSDVTHVRVKEIKTNMDTFRVTEREFSMSIKDWNYFNKSVHPKNLKFEVIERFSGAKASDEVVYGRMKAEYNSKKEFASASDIFGILTAMYAIKKEGWVASALQSYEKKVVAEKESIIRLDKISDLTDKATKFESEENLKKALECYLQAKVLDPENALIAIRIRSIKSLLKD